MEIDELKCSICALLYDEKERIPRVVLGCGHTYCEQCIIHNIENNNNESIFICRDDMTSNIIKNVEELPKNITLLRLIKNEKKLSFSGNKNELLNPNIITSNNDCSTPDKKSILWKISNYDRNIDMIAKSESTSNFNTINITNNNYNTINITPNNNNLRNSLRKNTTTEKINGKICIHHGRPLEIICVEDKEKICTNCALFGVHKNHNLINEEDFLREISIKTEILIDLYELIDFNILSFDQEISKNLEDLVKVNEDKNALLIKQVENNFSYIYEKIKQKEKEAIEKINEKKNEIDMKINSFKIIPKELLIKTEEWKNSVQNKLDKLNEITENEKDDLFQLIDNNMINQDLINSAESIVNEFVQTKNIPKHELEKTISDFNIEININNIDEYFKDIVKYKENIEIIDFDDNKEIIEFPKIDHNEVLTTSPNTIKGLEDINNSNNHINFSSNNSFLNISEDAAILKATNKPRINSTIKTIPINKISKSPPRITSDKVVFIKTQFKNEVANFTGYDIGDEGSKIIADLLSQKNCKVKELKLTKTNLTDEGAIIIFKSLENNNCVNNLNIAKNYISDKCIDCILNFFKTNKTVKTIYFTNNNFSTSSKEKLKSYNKNNMKLFI